MTRKHRKCSACGSTEHRADYHGSKRERNRMASTPLVLDGDNALKALVIPELAVYIVLSDQIDMALTGAIRGHQATPQSSTSLINAYARLAERARGIENRDLVAARSAWQRLQKAQADYTQAIEPIKKAIIP